MRTPTVVELEVARDAGFRRADARIGVQINLFVFDRLIEPHSRSTNTLSRQQPRLSMLTAMPWPCSIDVKASLMNCVVWSVLKISGLP